ncbi:MAG TPA: dihydrofolate reductase family protein [Jatrophihabitans sp.]|nr:dihydrofolate reductase family protein [Jatrophihabitans sp.]
MLSYSTSVSVDGFIADRDGGIGWTAPSDEVFAAHLQRVRGLGVHLCGRRLYETMLPWETDASLQTDSQTAEFARLWSALPKVVFSRTLTSVHGRARLADAPLATEIARARAATDKDVEVGGATLAAHAVELGLVDELQLFRIPVAVGTGISLLPQLNRVVQFELISTTVFDSGVVHERYRCSGAGHMPAAGPAPA